MDRTPVNVIGIFTSDGKIYPRHFLLQDGHKYNIEHVIDVRPEFSPFSGGTGLRYTVQIHGQRCSMWLEDMVWYLEGCVHRQPVLKAD